jgi:AbrB family looped-hinge helix DNA binding protein
METTIDAGGRIVVPKQYRDLLGLGPGQRVEIEVDGGQLRVAAVVAPSPVHEVDGVLVAGEPGVVAALGADEERALLDALRERRW